MAGAAIGNHETKPIVTPLTNVQPPVNGETVYMKKWKKKVMLGVGALLATAVAIGVLKIIFVDFVVDFWWFQSQDMALYYMLRLIYRYVVLILFAVFFFTIFYANFWIASRFVGNAASTADPDDKDLINSIHTGLRRFYLPLSLLMALPIAWPLFNRWETALQFILAPASPVTDPLFGKNISFYLFSLPIYELLQQEVLLAVTVLLLVVSFLYWYEQRLLAASDQALPRQAVIHIAVLALTIVVLLSWGVLLERYDLLYSTSNLPVFHGPGYVEMRVVLPFIWLVALLLAATGIALLVAVQRRRGWIVPAVLAVLFVVAWLGKNADFFTDTVRKYVVEPNQLVRERPYIEAGIRSTLAAYGLEDVVTNDIDTRSNVAFDAQDPAILRRLQNIPVWDREMLGGVYEELQGIRTYYSFPTIDVDRYQVQDSYRQVYLGAREIQFAKLPASAQNWINLHMQYTHGEGVAMIPAAQAGDEFMTWLIKDIPPTSEFGLSSKQTSIYFGLEDKPFVIVPNDVGEIGTPVGDEETIVNYTGKGGVAANSIWRKLLLALYFNDRNIFFTTKTNDDSRLLFRRNIIDRITHITPFLKLDNDPYVVSTPDGLFWMQDAYTTSNRYPLAPSVEEGFNYIRNSVKIVVDAYTGKVSYYVFDEQDPVVMAYRRMYPGLLQPRSSMPESLKKHVRYPRDIFLTQVSVYATYHQTNPDRFYRQEDIWEFSKIAEGRALIPAKPYYLTLDLIQAGKEEFLLFMPLSPFGRDNLRALMAAGSDGDNYGKIFVYRFPRDQQVYGPAQVHSLVNQDVIISEQFTLWDQEGSEVKLGKMIIEPTAGSLLYIQPVYLQEEGPLKIPQLKRLIMALDDAVVMAPSLEEAAVQLEAELLRKSTRRDKRFRTTPPSGKAAEQPAGARQGLIDKPKPPEKQTDPTVDDAPKPAENDKVKE
jgi:uncharacterized membrane protein (UPF0182 family)